MAFIRGVQLADAPNGITTTKINDNAVTDAKVDGSVLSTNTLNAAPGSDYTALGKKILSVADGTVSTDAVNFGQLQAAVQQMAWKDPCESATTAALPAYTVAGNVLTATANGALVVGGVTINRVGQRVLVKNESPLPPITPDSRYNGIYTLTQIGDAGNPWILTRAPGMDVAAEVPRAATTIDNPASTAFGSIYVVSSPLYPATGFVLNTTAITFSAIPLPTTLIAGLGISITGLTISTDIEVTPSASGRGLTYVSNKLSGDIEPNKGLKFDDTTGRFEAYLALTPSVQGGLQFGTNGGLAAFFETNQGLEIGPNSGLQVKVEPSTPTAGGLQIGPNGGIEAKLDANSSGIKYTALGLTVKTKTAVAVDSTGGLAINGSGELVAQANSTSGGLQINGSNEIEIKVEPSTTTSGGLQINANGGIEAKLNGSGGLDYSATGLTVKLGNPANAAAGLSLSANGLYNNTNNSKQNVAGAASAGSGTLVTATALAATPFRGNGGNGVVTVTINGVEYPVQDGGTPPNAELYFSGDGGVTCRSWATIQSGDGLYRGGALGFDTIVTDKLSMTYLTPIP